MCENYNILVLAVLVKYELSTCNCTRNNACFTRNLFDADTQKVIFFISLPFFSITS